MANLATRVLRLLVKRGHALLVSELEQAFPGAKANHAVHHAVRQLAAAGCVSWTTQGWLATAAGRTYVKMNTRLLFERDRRRLVKGGEL